ncbi:hypothetical protein AV530_000250 [Patagioenas fasciata monilis]|uniref:Uncharacterized protein n=1 Tax=Patagioenas fasciata monilis TaxID=372326 RepID=A0A1V4L1A3_PATFA|nr:hypothetical protein AV530_000250 [Patagioenas fasciata monilis]
MDSPDTQFVQCMLAGATWGGHIRNTVCFEDFLLDSAPLLNEMSFPQTETPSFDTNQEKTGVFLGFAVL